MGLGLGLGCYNKLLDLSNDLFVGFYDPILGWRKRGSALGWPEAKDSNSKGDFEEIKRVVTR